MMPALLNRAQCVVLKFKLSSAKLSTKIQVKRKSNKLCEQMEPSLPDTFLSSTVYYGYKLQPIYFLNIFLTAEALSTASMVLLHYTGHAALIVYFVALHCLLIL